CIRPPLDWRTQPRGPATRGEPATDRPVPEPTAYSRDEKVKAALAGVGSRSAGHGCTSDQRCGVPRVRLVCMVDPVTVPCQECGVEEGASNQVLRSGRPASS